jgi:hypothetical protein
MDIPERIFPRVMTRYEVADDGCWNTTYSLGSHGYGQVGWQDGPNIRMTVVHRVSWIARNGPIPDGMTVDHICKNKKCINPDHLRLLTRSENARRGADKDFPLGQCSRGHGDEWFQVRDHTGKKGCVLCLRASRARYEARNRPPLKDAS